MKAAERAVEEEKHVKERVEAFDSALRARQSEQHGFSEIPKHIIDAWEERVKKSAKTLGLENKVLKQGHLFG